MKHDTGKVEKIDYPQGGGVHQWTWINGVRYATFWDIHSIDWKLGDAVTFNSEHRPLHVGRPPVLQAFDIHKA